MIQNKAENTNKQIKNPWLQGWRDISIKFDQSFQQHIQVGDTKGDGENRLISITKNNQLVVYKGQQIEYQRKISSEKIVGIILFYLNNNKQQRIGIKQSIGIITNNEVIIFDDYEPYYKLTVENITISEKEINLYQIYFQNKDQSVLINGLIELKNDFYISDYSNELINIENKKQQSNFILSLSQDEFLANLKIQQIQDQIICFSKVCSDYNQKVENLVLGTESKKIYILNENGIGIKYTILLKDIPHQILCQKKQNIGINLIILNRNNRITLLQQLKMNDSNFSMETIEFESLPLKIVQSENNFLISTNENYVMELNHKLMMNWKVKLEDQILDLQNFYIKNKQIKGFIVALLNKQIQLFINQSLIYSLKCDDQIICLKYGIYSKEDNCLLIFYKEKGVDLRILPRQFSIQKLQNDLEEDKNMNNEDQQIIPKKTLLYVQDCEREKEEFQKMHKDYQQDLIKLKHKIAQQYLDLIKDESESNTFSILNKILRVNIDIEGVGPRYLIKIQVENVDQKYIKDLVIIPIFNTSYFSVENISNFSIPFLSPKVPVFVLMYLQNIEMITVQQNLQLSICQRGVVQPLINCVVQIPIFQNLQ